MMRRNWWLSLSVALPVALIAFSGWARVGVAQDKKAEAKPMDIVATAAANKDFSTLVELLTKAELVETLKGEGPFTVFAPTNEAFKKLGKETLDSLTKPENKAKLQGILKYHVHAGKAMAADVSKAKTIKTVNGQEATITVKDKTVMIDAATITATDIACTNGVIHVIDTVIMPKADH